MSNMYIERDESSVTGRDGSGSAAARGRGSQRTRDRVQEILSRLQLKQCPRCGKHCYGSRKIAKKAGRLLHPGTHMRRYKCGGYWHVTSMREQPRYLRYGDRVPARARAGMQEAA